MNYQVIPAIIAKDQKEFDFLLDEIKGYAKRIHLDIMDQQFVINSSLNFDFKLPKNIFFEAHLMVKDPLSWVEKYADKVDLIIFHYESTDDLILAIKKIKSKNKKVGIAINPETPISRIQNHLDQVDIIVIMTVYPGQYGAKFLPEMLEKVKALRKIYKGDIGVDGGIKEETIILAKKAGANLFYSGSYIMVSVDPVKAMKRLETLSL